MKKSVRAIIFPLILASLNIFPESVRAQDEFDEGGPPQEAPYINHENEFSDELDAPATATKTATKTTEPPRPTQATADIIEARPAETATLKTYQVPTKPTTQEGRETGREKIQHPMSSKGLLLIEKDGSYVYRTHGFESQNIGVLMKIGQINPPPRIEGPTPSITYESMYGSASPAQMMLDFEWYPFTKYGKLGAQVGLGFFTSTGKGRFADDNSEAREVYTFYGVPLSAGVVYRLQGGENWWFAPYIAGGGSYYLLAEKRDDNKPWKGVGVPAAYGAGGLLFNLSALDRETAFALVSEYGIRNMWLSAEFKYVKAASVAVDVSAAVISGGLVLDY